MDRDAILEALEAGEFDGISHEYQPTKHGRTTYYLDMEVRGSVIDVTRTSEGKTFDGHENERWEESRTEELSGSDALDFIEDHPYYFEQRLPDLF